MVYKYESFPFTLWTFPHLQDHIFFESGKNTVLGSKCLKYVKDIRLVGEGSSSVLHVYSAAVISIA